ncbi:SCO2524 family protein [Actinoplanes sp. HUAS TT8]|uniref:SCO2524 family protein n=1 Tax=Actinoplanes sp. HUAS TT8 TaxID=3447453 RepID=UPI003F520E18
MRIEPRQHLLETWKATVATSWRDGAWRWGGRDGANSISDAEQLLCILRPATQVMPFAVDRPNVTSDEILQALAPLGNERTVPVRLVEIATEYFERYRDETGRPTFAGGDYYSADESETLTDDQRGRDIVDSFAISVTLSLATIGFVRIFRQAVSRAELRERLRRLERLAGGRLTAAMIGLLRSFSTHVFDAGSEPGRTLVATLNPAGLPSRQVVAQFQHALQETIASFGEVLIGSGQTSQMQGADQLFECGWSWSVVKDAPTVAVAAEVDASDPADGGAQPEGCAENKPYLYFTVIAVDAIEDLFSERTRVLGLLSEEQQRLARALQLRWDLTLTYWATVATFGDGSVWPLENPPWQTTDTRRSEYYTLLVTSIVAKDLVRRRGSDTQLGRIGAVLADLANEARVTRQHHSEDSAIRLHEPGLLVPLAVAADADDEPKSTPWWSVGEFSTLLLRQCLTVAALLTEPESRARMLRLADRVWDHIARRRFTDGEFRGLWDQPSQVFETVPEHAGPSWYHTERVVRGLVGAAGLVSQEPLVNDRLVGQAYDLLYEAEHLYDMELMRGSAGVSLGLKDHLTEIRTKLERARAIARTRPAVAVASASAALEMLGNLDAARDSSNTVL